MPGWLGDLSHLSYPAELRLPPIWNPDKTEPGQSLPSISSIMSPRGEAILHAPRRNKTLLHEQASKTKSFFVDLPPELRVYIWELALPDPQIFNSISAHDSAWLIYEPPVMINICIESRAILFANNPLIMAIIGDNFEFAAVTTGLWRISAFSNRQLIYYNPSVDTMYLGMAEHDALLIGRTVKRFTRRLVLDFPSTVGWADDERCAKWLPAHFPNLTELILIVWIDEEERASMYIDRKLVRGYDDLPVKAADIPEYLHDVLDIVEGQVEEDSLISMVKEVVYSLFQPGSDEEQDDPPEESQVRVKLVRPQVW